MSTRDHWLAQLAGLHIDRSRGPAPHKPLLLLAILNRLDEGEPLPERFALTPELAFRFQTLWTVVTSRRTQRPDIRLPFHHLQSDAVWSAVTADGVPSPHARLTRTVVVDSDFGTFIADAQNRQDAKRVLICGDYFMPAERLALAELVGIPLAEVEAGDAGINAALAEETLGRGREAQFRLRVVAAYNYTCALTGYRLTTIDGATIVDAAHIHQFADSRNNDLCNGLALSKNAHWMFDEGLWTISDDYTVIVAADALHEDGPVGMRLAPFGGKPLAVLPSDTAARPNPVHLAWHRRHAFASAREL